jgi:F0F1-type ATP synthase beta subunit
MVKTNLNKGYVTQIIGPVLDIKFSEGNYHLFIVQSEFR